MTRARLTLLAQARKDMIDLRRYSLREFGRNAADRYVDDIRSVFLLLRDHPHAGAPAPEMESGIRLFSKRRHRVYYRISGLAIEIVRVLHHSQNVSRHLDQ